MATKLDPDAEVTISFTITEEFGLTENAADLAKRLRVSLATLAKFIAGEETCKPDGAAQVSLRAVAEVTSDIFTVDEIEETG